MLSTSTSSMIRSEDPSGTLGLQNQRTKTVNPAKGVGVPTCEVTPLRLGDSWPLCHGVP